MKPLEVIKIPKDNVNDKEVIITNVYVKDSQKIQSNTHLVDYETSKANFELHSEVGGFIRLKCNEGDTVEVSSAIIEIYEEPFVNDAKGEKESKTNLKQNFSKKALEKIKEYSLDLNLFDSTSLITEQLVEDTFNKIQKDDVVAKIVSINHNKRKEIENLSDSSRLGLVSSVSKSFKVDIEKVNKYHTFQEFQDTVSTIIINIASKLLSHEKYHHLNSYVSENVINIYKSVNFGLALNLGSGLKIGVIKNSNKMDIAQIESRIIELIDSYIDNKMSLDDVEGSTVVLTDLTDQNVDSFSPLILKNNSIMLGLSGVKGEYQTITIAFDHRVSDGLEIAEFLNDIISKLGLGR